MLKDKLREEYGHIKRLEILRLAPQDDMATQSLHRHVV